LLREQYDLVNRHAPRTNSLRKIAFIDLEASGLSANSWPIEIGWVVNDHEAQSILLKPEPNWPLSAWDYSAEKLHGISQKRLAQDGINCAQACKLVNDALEETDVYSDAPDWDGFWLLRAFHAAGTKPSFKLKDYSKLILSILPEDRNALFRQADAISPRTHRAAADAKHLRTLYKLATSNRKSPILP